MTPRDTLTLFSTCCGVHDACADAAAAAVGVSFLVAGRLLGPRDVLQAVRV